MLYNIGGINGTFCCRKLVLTPFKFTLNFYKRAKRHCVQEFVKHPITEFLTLSFYCVLDYKLPFNLLMYSKPKTKRKSLQFLVEKITKIKTFNISRRFYIVKRLLICISQN